MKTKIHKHLVYGYNNTFDNDEIIKKWFQANTRRWPNVGLTLSQRRRRWANVSKILGQRLVLVGLAGP